MKFTEPDFGAHDPIEGYGADFFRIKGTAHPAPLIVYPGSERAWTGLEDTDSLIQLKDQVDVVFIGMGADIAPLPPSIRETLEAADVAYELMSSPAACRTYNVLLAEGRRIALALLPTGTQSA